MAKDAPEWLPELNHCWYIDCIFQVRREYGLTIRGDEADAMHRVPDDCESTEMAVLAPGASVATATPTPATETNVLALYDDNENSSKSCAEARAHHIETGRRGHSAYDYMRDADGVVCE